MVHTAKRWNRNASQSCPMSNKIRTHKSQYCHLLDYIQILLLNYWLQWSSFCCKWQVTSGRQNNLIAYFYLEFVILKFFFLFCYFNFSSNIITSYFSFSFPSNCTWVSWFVFISCKHRPTKLEIQIILLFTSFVILLLVS